MPVWNQELVFTEPLDSLISQDTILFFEMVDLASQTVAKINADEGIVFAFVESTGFKRKGLQGKVLDPRATYISDCFN